MELFIRIKDGVPFEHPIFGDNFRDAFPDVDTNNLPVEFAKFERVAQPNVAGVYQVEEVSYQWVDGVVKDVWSVRDMTETERQVKINEIKNNWALNGFLSWSFNEDLCMYVPPTPMPVNGKPHRWDEPSLTWIELT